MRSQKIQNTPGKQLAVEGEGIKITWTDAEDISESFTRDIQLQPPNFNHFKPNFTKNGHVFTT